jgi:L-amino acid N-acyltransferase YncA
MPPQWIEDRMIGKALLRALARAITALSFAHGQDAVKIDPGNPKYLRFRGKPHRR